jgi:hypothetical protein
MLLNDYQAQEHKYYTYCFLPFEMENLWKFPVVRTRLRSGSEQNISFTCIHGGIRNEFWFV